MSVRKQAESATKDPVLEAAEEQVAASDELPDLSSYSAEDTAKITKIQANARGLNVRKQAEGWGSAKPSAAEQPEEAADAAPGQLPDLAPFSAEDTAKITKIQANARGMNVRKQSENQA